MAVYCIVDLQESVGHRIYGALGDMKALVYSCVVAFRGGRE